MLWRFSLFCPNKADKYRTYSKIREKQQDPHIWEIGHWVDYNFLWFQSVSQLAGPQHCVWYWNILCYWTVDCEPLNLDCLEHLPGHWLMPEDDSYVLWWSHDFSSNAAVRFIFLVFTVVEDVFRFTSVKVLIPHCENTPLKAKVLILQ